MVDEREGERVRQRWTGEGKERRRVRKGRQKEGMEDEGEGERMRQRWREEGKERRREGRSERKEGIERGRRKEIWCQG